MTGLQLKLSTAFTNTALPVLYADEIMSTGSLVLIDPTHPYAPWVAGVPANNALVPNIAAQTARTLLAASSDDAVSAVAFNPGTMTGSAGLLERTGKGGMAVIAPQGGMAIAGSGLAIAMRNNLTSYILANATHSYFASVWMRLTRSAAAAYGNDTTFGINGNGQQTNSTLVNIAPNPTTTSSFNIKPGSGGPHTLGIRTPLSTLDNHIINVGIGGWQTSLAGVDTRPAPLPGDGTQPATTGSYAGGTISFGSSSAVNGIGTTGATAAFINLDPTSLSTNKDKAGSKIVYRVYVEDLTVSGRTYAQLDALDFAAYTREVLTTGGRYYGDTFTDPTTIP